MNRNPKIRKYIQSLSALSQSSDDYLYVWDIKNDVNWFFGDIDGDFDFRDNGEPETTTQRLLSVVHPKDKQALREDLYKVKIGEKKDHNLDYRWVNREGKPVWINCRGKVIDDDKGEPMVLLGRVSRSAFENKVNRITGMFNKRKLYEDAKAKKLLSSSGYFLLLGIDRLVKVYSEYGREYMQSLVENGGKILDEYASETSLVYHVEDAIFAICLVNADESGVKEVYESISEKTKEMFTITAVAVPSDQKYFADEKDLFENAMGELERAKKNRRAKLTFFTKEKALEQIDLMSLAYELEYSVKSGFKGFYVRYQPQMTRGDYAIYGVEALMRFRSKGIEYAPMQFIPLMEQAGLIKEAGLWILKTAIEQVKVWRKKIPDLHLNVNFSLAQLTDPEVIEAVIKIFKESGLPPKSLVIELTETVKAEEAGDVSVITRAWKEAGIEIAIDDFGTGYSNLALLKEIECDEIKMERSFVSHVKEGSYGYLLINSVIDFAHANGIRVCCEGVETINDVVILSQLNPDLFQGFVFDKPCTVQEFTEWYVNDKSVEYRRRRAKSRRLRRIDEDRITHFDPKEILTNIGVGLCVMNCDMQAEIYEMHPDNVLEGLLGMSGDLSPLECNEFWFTRIKEGYAGFVRKSLEELLITDKVVQFVYPWIHPTKGELVLSFSGVLTKHEGNKISVRCLHRVVSSIERLGVAEKNKPLRYFMQSKYIDIILNNAIAFMEINLSQNRVVGGLRDILGNQPKLGKDKKKLIDENGNLRYEEFENWWADKYLVSSREEFFKVSNCRYLMDCYASGEQSIEFFCRGIDRYGKVYDCKKAFFINKDDIMGDVTALCVMYDVSEQTKEKIEDMHRDNTIRAMSDDYKSVMYVNLLEDTVAFYREDETLGDWREEISGHTQMMSTFADRFVTEKDRAEYKYLLSSKNLIEKLTDNEEFRFEYERRCKGGVIRTHEVKVKRDQSTAVGLCAIIGVKDIEEEIQLRKHLKEALDMAYTDHLTGLYNQQGLSVKSKEILRDTSVNSAVIFMDLDNFKLVNDAYGHSTGDKVLLEVGKVLKEETRGKDVVGRYGGDEFVALLYNIKGEEEGVSVAERIAEGVRGVCKRIGLKIDVTASIGISFTKQTGHDYRYLKEIADDRLYLAKKRGKNIIVKYS